MTINHGTHEPPLCPIEFQQSKCDNFLSLAGGSFVGEPRSMVLEYYSLC